MASEIDMSSGDKEKVGSAGSGLYVTNTILFNSVTTAPGSSLLTTEV